MGTKLEEIQALATFHHQQLIREFGPEAVAAGGNLFLGKYYVASDRIFLSLNPGTYRTGHINPFVVKLRGDNAPWGHPSSKFAFWLNCTFFFGCSSGLANWIEEATSTFAIPWRSRSLSNLRSHPKLEERIRTYSRELLRKMVEHHQAKILIVSGVATVKIVADFLGFPLNSQTIECRFDGAGYRPYGIYQWMRVNPSKSGIKGLIGETIIYQVPHFSRAVNKQALRQCASWLWENIGTS